MHDASHTILEPRGSLKRARAPVLWLLFSLMNGYLLGHSFAHVPPILGIALGAVLAVGSYRLATDERSRLANTLAAFIRCFCVMPCLGLFHRPVSANARRLDISSFARSWTFTPNSKGLRAG